MTQKRSFIPLDDARAPFFVGVDLGGTNIKVGVVDDTGRSLSWLSAPTDPEKGPEDASRRMGEAVLEAVRQAGLSPTEIARVVRRLVSDEFSYMTGTCLDIDGGALLAVVTENDLDASWTSTKFE